MAKARKRTQMALAWLIAEVVEEGELAMIGWVQGTQRAGPLDGAHRRDVLGSEATQEEDQPG